jgi:8-oxo-dGTP diphosphatase
MEPGDVKFPIGKTVFALAADAVIMHKGRVVLMLRGKYPYEGYWVIPGGRVNVRERLRDTAAREAFEETGLRVKTGPLVGVYDSLHRDPRGRYITAAFLCKAKKFKPRTSDEAREVRLFSFSRLPKRIGFDHRLILRDARKLLRR